MIRGQLGAQTSQQMLTGRDDAWGPDGLMDCSADTSLDK